MELQRFDVSKLALHTNIIILGKRGTGKSILVRDIMYRLSTQLDFGVAFSPTESSREMFAEFMPRASIYPEFRYEVVEKMLQFQRSRDNNNAAPEVMERNKNWRRSLFCVLDDCLFDKDVLKGKAISDLFMNGRHQRITLLVVAQDAMALAPALRQNSDYIFAFRDTILSSRMKLFTHYFGIMGDFQTFIKAMKAGTEDRRALVLDNRSASNDPQEAVFYYKAQFVLPKFYVGRRSFYRLNAQHTVPAGGKVASAAPGYKKGGNAVDLGPDDGLPPPPPPRRSSEPLLAEPPRDPSRKHREPSDRSDHHEHREPGEPREPRKHREHREPREHRRHRNK